jgi:hypothetical protein
VRAVVAAPSVAAPPVAAPPPAAEETDEAVIEHLSGKTVVLTAADLSRLLAEKTRRQAREGVDLALAHLSDCTVVVLGVTRALRAESLQRCHLYLAPVAGSLLLAHLTDCVLFAPARQVRIHDSRNSDFYLRCASRPILERSSGLRFAPYSMRYDRLATHLREAGLEHVPEDAWRSVDDFDWLRQQASPNWSVLPPEARLATPRSVLIALEGPPAPRAAPAPTPQPAAPAPAADEDDEL